jgi:hypothetical protein
MNYPSYPFTQSEDALCFDFASISEQKVIQKRVIYSRIGPPTLYNLAMGDVGEDGILNDAVRSNNDDLPEVIATVFQTLLAFFRIHPNSRVLFRGSDPKGFRTRLYRIIISRELNKLAQLFEIYGVYENASIEAFEPNKPYIAFIIKLKL